MKLFGKIFLSRLAPVALCFFGTVSWAMDSTETLPASVSSPALRYGIVSGVDSKYTANGSVATLNDINTIHFDSSQLKKINPEIEQLIFILNQFPGKFGDQLNLGTLRVETEPNVHYLAPIYAFGVTERLTLAVAAPVVFYKNKLRIVQSASNINKICDELNDGGPSEDLKNACARLRNTRMKDEVRSELAKKGYRPIQDRDDTVFGDLQLVSLWRFFELSEHSALWRTSINLPTGSPNDPDDLADLGVFGQMSVEPMLFYNWLPLRGLRLAAKAGYKFMVPTWREVRVPQNEDDVIPGMDAKERVLHKIGDSLTLGMAITLNPIGAFTLAGGYEVVRKGRDSYSGQRRSPYSLLAKNSESVAQRLRASIGYDTIDLYQRTKSFPPLKVEFEVLNTVAGRNTDRQLVNEVSLTMFF